MRSCQFESATVQSMEAGVDQVASLAVVTTSRGEITREETESSYEVPDGMAPQLLKPV
jgi:hypothetical protein